MRETQLVKEKGQKGADQLDFNNVTVSKVSESETVTSAA